MGCTTILVGKNASYDGSTMIARNEDGGDRGTPKKFMVVTPDMQPGVYRSVLSDVVIPLPKNPMRYTAMPNALRDEGMWPGAGINAANVSMTATETITSNPRVQAADPLTVEKTYPDDHMVRESVFRGEEPLSEASGLKRHGIGEEDLVALVLPYVRSAREGAARLGALLEEYGTYEMNGIAFQDADEIWWLETIGGHHWIAKRVPDDAYVVMPNQFGIDEFDLDDAFGSQSSHMCSSDLLTFIAENHLDLSLDGAFSPRLAFGSATDGDHVYNTPRAWYMLRYFNPHTYVWDGPDADYTPESDDLPWSLVPERKITVEDVKYILSSHYQGTPYDPYGKRGAEEERRRYRPIGISRTNFLTIGQIRPNLPEECRAVEWVTYGSNVFNAVCPFFTNVDRAPAYISEIGDRPTTENFYWANRILGEIADAHYNTCIQQIERYQDAVHAAGHRLAWEAEKEAAGILAAGGPGADDRVRAVLEDANEELAAMLRRETDRVLAEVIQTAGYHMTNRFSRADG